MGQENHDAGAPVVLGILFVGTVTDAEHPNPSVLELDRSVSGLP
jgi:hypothetical protein